MKLTVPAARLAAIFRQLTRGLPAYVSASLAKLSGDGSSARMSADGAWARPDNAGSGTADELARDLPLIAAAIVHAERREKVSSKPSSEGGRRSQWRTVGRREAMRGNSWS